MATGLHQRPVMGQTSIRSEGNAKCSIHRNKEFVFVCSDCKEFVCTACCVSRHRNHTLEEIEDVSLRQRDKLVDFINDTEENKLPELQTELNAIEEKETENEHNLGKVLPEQIKQHGEMYKSLIDRHIKQINSSCQEKKNENIELILIYKNQIQKRYDHLVQLTKECKHVLQSGTSVLVFDKVKDVECLKPEPLSMPPLCTPEYQPGADIPLHIKHLIGTIDTCKPSCPKPDIQQRKQRKTREILTCLGALKNQQMEKVIPVLKKMLAFVGLVLLLIIILFVVFAVKAFHIGTKCAHKSKLIPAHDGSVWFSDKASNAILFSNDGTMTQIPKDQRTVLDISSSPKTGNLWLISEYDRAIYKLTPPIFLPCICFHVYPFPAFSLHVTNEDNLVLGSWGYLEILRKDGTVRHKTYDVSLLYKVTGQITECPVTGNLAVVRTHVMEPHISDIAVYDKTLNILFYYNVQGFGWNSVVAYDTFGNILIGNTRTMTVYMISGTGEYIKHLFDVKGDLISIANQKPCNILWMAVQQDLDLNRKEIEIKQKLLDLQNPSKKCKQLRQNVLKTKYKITKDRETENGFLQTTISYIKTFLSIMFKIYTAPSSINSGKIGLVAPTFEYVAEKSKAQCTLPFG